MDVDLNNWLSFIYAPSPSIEDFTLISNNCLTKVPIFNFTVNVFFTSCDICHLLPHTFTQPQTYPYYFFTFPPAPILLQFTFPNLTYHVAFPFYHVTSLLLSACMTILSKSAQSQLIGRVLVCYSRSLLVSLSQVLVCLCARAHWCVVGCVAVIVRQWIIYSAPVVSAAVWHWEYVCVHRCNVSLRDLDNINKIVTPLDSIVLAPVPGNDFWHKQHVGLRTKTRIDADMLGWQWHCEFM